MVYKSIILNGLNALLDLFNVRLIKLHGNSVGSIRQVPDPATSYMHNDNLKKMLNEKLAVLAETYFLNQTEIYNKNNINLLIEIQHFMSLYSKRTFIENTGGSGFHNSFWIYLFTKILDPQIIVESGVWKGHTTWLLREASNDASIYAFDIDLSKLEYNNLRCNFFEYDWYKYDFVSINGENALVYFDCHVNHARRIIESHERGFKHLIFDDNPPVHILYGYGLPGFPTANIIWNMLNIKDFDHINWRWHDKECKYDLNKQELSKARSLIKRHEVFPDVGGFSRYGGFSYLTYVQLV